MANNQKIYRIYFNPKYHNDIQVYDYKNDGSVNDIERLDFIEDMKYKGFRLINEFSLHNASYRRLIFKEVN